MALSAGTRLGPYEIVAPLGAGGMGEVYRARDTRLERDIAIKVLPQHLSSDPDVKVRFEREARAISSLNHPHICHLYDVGSQNGVDYLVMELLEGETLADRLLKGPLLLKQALEYGAQVAEALDKAHRQGIVHRDLKPGNVMLTRSGAKLMDFGLAKPAPSMAAMASSSAETMSKPLTAEGKIVGTFQYMAPEQIQGQNADARTDIFALGAVLYEMVTGRRAFAGKSQISVMSAILEKEPEPINAVKPTSPPALDHAIRRCLAKDPEERWQTARDLALELKWLGEPLSQAAIAPQPMAGRASQWAGWSLALVAAVAAALLAFAYFHRTPPEKSVVRFMIPPPEGGAFIFNNPVGGAFLSPDGNSVAFIARVGTARQQLWVRSLSSFTARPLPGTGGAILAFWSPDSRNLGFFEQGKLQRISVAGGPSQVLCETGQLRGASWGTSDVIIFAGVGGEIQSISASGGTPRKVTTLDANRHEGTHRWPYFLPDGNHFLFTASLLGPVSAENVFYLASLDGKPSRVLAHGSSNIAYASGHVLYVAGGNELMARPFDPVELEFTGEATTIAEGVQFDPLVSNGIFSASENGRLLYQQGKGVAHSLWLLDRTGRQLKRLGDSAQGAAPRFSPDGRSVAYDSMSTEFGRMDLWMQDLASGARTRLASDELALGSHSAVWSPDGTRLAYVSAKGGGRSIYIRAVSQITQEEKRFEASREAYYVLDDWTPDGKALTLTWREVHPGLYNVSLLPVAGRDDPVRLLESKGANVSSSKVSPDGHWIAYRSDESGKPEIYISSFPNPVGRLQVSTDGGVVPRWSHDGRTLYYLAADKKLMAAQLKESNGSLQVISTHPLFDMPNATYLTPAGVNQYDVTHDGSEFAVDSLDTDASSASLSVVLNWPQELKK